MDSEISVAQMAVEALHPGRYREHVEYSGHSRHLYRHSRENPRESLRGKLAIADTEQIGMARGGNNEARLERRHRQVSRGVAERSRQRTRFGCIGQW